MTKYVISKVILNSFKFTTKMVKLPCVPPPYICSTKKYNALYNNLGACFLEYRRIELFLILIHLLPAFYTFLSLEVNEYFNGKIQNNK